VIDVTLRNVAQSRNRIVPDLRPLLSALLLTSKLQQALDEQDRQKEHQEADTQLDVDVEEEVPWVMPVRAHTENNRQQQEKLGENLSVEKLAEAILRLSAEHRARLVALILAGREKG
jgi:hypothetical protein